MTVKMRNRIDGTYTRMLRAVLGVSWKEHKTNKELYGNLPKITDTLTIRRLRFLGHCWRKKDEVISDLLRWEPKHGARKRGRPATTYVDQLRNDTGLSIAELKSIMENRIRNGWSSSSLEISSKQASKYYIELHTRWRNFIVPFIIIVIVMTSP